jgi:hypothetical protein
MNLDARYGTTWYRYCESACRLAVLLELGRKIKRLFTLKKDAILTQQCGGSDPVLLECQPVALLTPQHKQNRGLLPVYVISSAKCTYLRKSSFLATLMVVSFIRKRSCNIRKIYRFIKIITGREA